MKIPDGVEIRLSGTAGKLEDAKSRFGTVLLLAVVISFLLLAALFEDFLAPVAVLVTVPSPGRAACSACGSSTSSSARNASTS